MWQRACAQHPAVAHRHQQVSRETLPLCVLRIWLVLARVACAALCVLTSGLGRGTVLTRHRVRMCVCVCVCACVRVRFDPITQSSAHVLHEAQAHADKMHLQHTHEAAGSRRLMASGTNFVELLMVAEPDQVHTCDVSAARSCASVRKGADKSRSCSRQRMHRHAFVVPNVLDSGGSLHRDLWRATGAQRSLQSKPQHRQLGSSTLLAPRLVRALKPRRCAFSRKCGLALVRQVCGGVGCGRQRGLDHHARRSVRV